jgi:hypothetical protein
MFKARHEELMRLLIQGMIGKRGWHVKGKTGLDIQALRDISDHSSLVGIYFRSPEKSDAKNLILRFR